MANSGSTMAWLARPSPTALFTKTEKQFSLANENAYCKEIKIHLQQELLKYF